MCTRIMLSTLVRLSSNDCPARRNTPLPQPEVQQKGTQELARWEEWDGYRYY